MLWNKIYVPVVCVGAALAFATFGPVKATAQSESPNYHDRWYKPFCMQPLWDEKKVEDQDMRWDIKITEPTTAKHDENESERWHDRWDRPFAMQPLWDEKRIEDREMHWDIKVEPTTDMKDSEESAMWHDRWARPFNMQPAWDEARWEMHCMHRGETYDYRHKDSDDNKYSSK
jgi:hypothetical protein